MLFMFFFIQLSLNDLECFFLKKPGFMDSTDLIRLTVQCPELDCPISLPFMRVAARSTFVWNTTCAAVLWIICHRSVIGDWSGPRQSALRKGHKKKCYVDLEKSLKEKKSFIKIITEMNYAVEPLSRPKLNLTNIRNGIRYERLELISHTLFTWREKKDTSYFISFVLLECLIVYLPLAFKWNVHLKVFSPVNRV